jgi:hypothetical protein
MYIIYLLGLVLEELLTMFPPIWDFLMSKWACNWIAIIALKAKVGW